MRTLFLHIGTPKTATTSIQMFCVENSSILNKKGFCYPLLDFKYPNVEKRRNGHFIIGHLYRDSGERNLEKEEQMWLKGLDMVHSSFSEYDNVILSDEHMWTSLSHKLDDNWQRLADDAKLYDYSIKVIVYLRRQDDYANSWLSQQIKEGWGKYARYKWDDYLYSLTGTGYDYYKVLERLAEVIGRENICVRIFDRSIFKNQKAGIYSDFTDTLGLEYTDEFSTDKKENNISISGNAQDIRRIMNSVVPINPKIRSYIRKKSEYLEANRDKDYDLVMMTEKERENIMARFKASNDAVARDYMGLPEGTELFSTPSSSEKRWTRKNSFMPGDVTAFLGLIVSEQYNKLKNIKEKLSSCKCPKGAVDAPGSTNACTDSEQKLQMLAAIRLWQLNKIQAINAKLEAIGEKVPDHEAYRTEIQNLLREINTLEEKNNGLAKMLLETDEARKRMVHRLKNPLG